ncbi:MAG: hypothetical protein ACJAYS_000785 [Lentimonas sp.]
MSNGQSLTDLGYGTEISQGATLFLDDSNQGFESGEALVSIGYFTSIPSSFEASVDIFTDWVSISDSSAFNGSIPGFFSANETSFDVTPYIGTTPYLAVFQGIDDFSSLASSTGFILVQDSSWSSITGAESPSVPTTSNYRSLTFDTIELGTLQLDLGFDGGDGISASQIVPEPSTYALFAGVLAFGYIVIRRSRSQA